MHISKRSSGFTIIELMVSISIMSVLLSLVLYNYRTFSNRLAVSGNAQDLNLTIRQTQAFRTSTQESSAGAGDFTTPYGLVFRRVTQGDPMATYLLFADKDGNNRYNSSLTYCLPDTECVQQLALRDNVAVGYIKTAGDAQCDVNPEYVTILFKRATADPVISTYSRAAGFRTCQSVQIGVYKTDPAAGAILSEVSVTGTGAMGTTDPQSCGAATVTAYPERTEPIVSTLREFVYPAHTITTYANCPDLRVYDGPPPYTRRIPGT